MGRSRPRDGHSAARGVSLSHVQADNEAAEAESCVAGGGTDHTAANLTGAAAASTGSVY